MLIANTPQLYSELSVSSAMQYQRCKHWFRNLCVCVCVLVLGDSSNNLTYCDSIFSINIAIVAKMTIMIVFHFVTCVTCIFVAL